MKQQTNSLHCPLPDSGPLGQITLAHGEGGRLMRRLLRDRILPIFNDHAPQEMPDAWPLPSSTARLAMTTDSYVVSPLEFPGGNIGSLAVHGTVNDLAVAGAVPQWLSLSLIIEDGLAWETLERILRSCAASASGAGVAIVTGDTKVVPRGAVDRLFINTTGIGALHADAPPGPEFIEAGDRLIVSGPIARHGIAIMAAREQLEFEPPVHSDSAPLHEATQALLEAGVPVRAMRDATRGGVAAVLQEWAEAAGLTLRIDAEWVPVPADVRAACELLGLDPLHVANEGTMVVAVPAAAEQAALNALRRVPVSRDAATIGQTLPRDIAGVVVRQPTGVDVVLDEPLGAPLPRIC